MNPEKENKRREGGGIVRRKTKRRAGRCLGVIQCNMEATGCCRRMSVPYGFCLSELGKILCLDEKCEFQD